MCVVTILTGMAIGAALGAASGGIWAGVTGGDIGRGILLGAAGGALGGGVGAGVGTVSAIGWGIASGALAGSATNYTISARETSTRQQKQQEEAIRKLQENQGTLETSKVTNGLQDNSRISRTLSSLRVSMLPQKQTNEEITKNVYGVDTNQVASATQNMTGLNIAIA